MHICPGQNPTCCRFHKLYCLNNSYLRFRTHQSCIISERSQSAVRPLSFHSPHVSRPALVHTLAVSVDGLYLISVQIRQLCWRCLYPALFLIDDMICDRKTLVLQTTNSLMSHVPRLVRHPFIGLSKHTARWRTSVDGLSAGMLLTAAGDLGTSCLGLSAAIA